MPKLTEEGLAEIFEMLPSLAKQALDKIAPHILTAAAEDDKGVDVALKLKIDTSGNPIEAVVEASVSVKHKASSTAGQVEFEAETLPGMSRSEIAEQEQMADTARPQGKKRARKAAGTTFTVVGGGDE